jgi:hypothetical protein
VKFRSDRERNMVVWGSVAGVLLLWFSLFLLPTARQIRALVNLDIPRARQSLQTARSLAGWLAANPAKPVTPASQRSLAGQLDTIVRQQIKIPPEHIKSIKDVGHGAQMQLTDIDRTTLVRLLHALEVAHIRPDSADFNQLGRTEMIWDVTITVNGPPAGAP